MIRSTKVPQDAIQTWIELQLSESPLRARSLIATLLGDAIAPHGGAVWLGGLITLAAAFGLNERLIRTSVFRATEEGWLQAQRHGRLSLYRLSPAGLRRFNVASRLIYAPIDPPWDGSWVQVVLPKHSELQGERTDLRRELEWLGYRLIAPGIMLRPGSDTDAAAEVLASLGVQDKTMLLMTRDATVPACKPLADVTASHWELDKVAQAYQRLTESWQPLLAWLQATAINDAPGNPAASRPDLALTGLQAFQIRTLAIHAFRRCVLSDPQFPQALLPQPWPGRDAYASCAAIYRTVFAASEQYLAEHLQGPPGHDAWPSGNTELHQRFGGLR